MGNNMFDSYKKNRDIFMEKYQHATDDEAEVFALAVINDLSLEEGTIVHMNRFEAIQGAFRNNDPKLLTSIING